MQIQYYGINIIVDHVVNNYATDRKGAVAIHKIITETSIDNNSSKIGGTLVLEL